MIPRREDLKVRTEQQLTKVLEQYIADELNKQVILPNQEVINILLPRSLTDVASYAIVLLNAAGYDNVRIVSTEALGTPLNLASINIYL